VCGIAGQVRLDRAPDPGEIAGMLDLLAHRGPDGEGLWSAPGHQSHPGPQGTAPWAALGHRRLAILDLSDAGAQPMVLDDGDGLLALTYNGEIYNYLEVRAELEARGHRFRSRSDTEVLLRAWRAWGPDCLARLNGMFAFALWDGGRRELFAARDRFGEKPFHYLFDARRGLFAFASEIKALLALPEATRALDDRALYRYVAFQELAGAEATLWQGIRRLPPASWLRLAHDGGELHLTVRRYWTLDLDREEDIPVTEAARRFAELFADSVRLRLRSDVPVGSSLSGGLDSSAVVCQIHALGAAGGQQTFTARMEEPALDEGRYVAAVRAATGVAGHDVWPRAEDLTTLFPRLCHHLEEPFLSTSQLAQHLVMRLAREHGVTVLLDGQGADELLAGYRPYFLTRAADLAERRRLLALWREWRGFRARRADPFPLTAKGLLARLLPAGLRRRRTAVGAAPLRWPALARFFDPGWLAGFAHEAPPVLPAARRDALTRRLAADTLGGELQELLRYGDRNSMAWSRELRQPFLDHRLAELAFALPVRTKLDRGETKVVLRRAIAGPGSIGVPAEVVARQDKLGYQAPLVSWLRGPLAPWTAERLAVAAEVLGGRLAGDPAGRWRTVAGAATTAEAEGLFALLTLGETTLQMRSMTLPPRRPAGQADQAERVSVQG
jgi:asparagine synthase (glutamine-hydrolysing)